MAVARYAIIGRDGTVENIIVWDEKGVPLFAAGAAVLIKSGENVSIGDDFDGERFMRPATAPIDVAGVRAECMLAIETEFRKLSGSMFISPNEREAMRVTALACVGLVGAADTHEEVLAATKEALATLRSHMK